MRHVLWLALSVLAAAAPPAAAQDAPADAAFLASSRGQVYYPRACDAWRDLPRANLVGFSSEAEAQRAGYRRTTNRRCGPARPAGERAEAPPAPATSSTCTISRVYDGDTVTCRGGERVRLLLVDAPEMDQGPFGREARGALLRLAPLGTTVRLEHDVERVDRYGRTLAYLWTDEGRLVNEELARAGYALSLTYPPNVRHVERIRDAVEEARAARRGLWAGRAFACTPRDHRAGRCG